MRMAVKQYTVESDEGEITVSLWVTPEGELTVDVDADGSEQMDLETAAIVAAKIRLLTRMPLSEVGAKKIRKVQKKARKALDSIERRRSAHAAYLRLVP